MARRLPAVPRMSETPRSTTEIKPPSAREDGGAPCSADALLAQLKSSTDLAWLVERVVRNDLPWVVVPAAALRAWEEGIRSGGPRCRPGWPPTRSPSFASDGTP